MQEDEFEKQVQKLMDNLSFDPKDTVWSVVASEIEKDKKRRKPLFWILLIGIPVIIGTGYLLSAGNFSAKTPVFNPLQDDSLYSNQSPNKTTITKDSSEVLVKKLGLVTSQLVTGKEGRKEKTKAGRIPEKNIQKNGPVTEKLNSEYHADAAQTAVAISGIKNDPVDSSVAAVPGPFPSGVQDSVAETKKTATRDKKKSAWSFGLTSGPGVSGISQSAVNQGYAYAPAGSTGGGYPVPVYTSHPTAGFSFSAGAFVSRTLSGRLYISGGLNYHYYSTRAAIGNLVSNSGGSYNSNMLYFSPVYYTNSSSRSFTNQYHFAELPLSVDYILNKNKKYALIGEAGVSFAYLVSSDFLYFDPSANVYYKNNQLLNRDQWNISTALLVGLKMHTNRILIGPQIQYGLSGLLNASPVYSQHLFSLGLKISFIPGRN